MREPLLRDRLVDPPRFRPALDFFADDLRADDLRAGDFLAEDFFAEDFLAEELRPDDFLAEVERPPELRERERRLPADLRPPDFLDVAMKRLRK